MNKWYFFLLVDGVWSEWSSWNRCSADCGGGSQRRFHTCSNPPPSRYGLSCPGISRLSQNLTRSTNATINDMDRDYLGVEKDSYLEPTTPVFEIRACNEMPCIPWRMIQLKISLAISYRKFHKPSNKSVFPKEQPIIITNTSLITWEKTLLNNTVQLTFW